MKKIVCLLAFVIMSLATMMGVYANEDTVIVDRVKFSADMKRLIEYPKDKTDEIYEIPHTVEFIQYNAFGGAEYPYEGNQYLKSVVIPDSMTSVSECAFSGCSNLENVNIPDSVRYIEKAGFYRCKNLKNIQLPENLISIGDAVFDYCENLEKIEIPNTVSHIGNNAFSMCKNLKEIIIPEGIKSIEQSTFVGCKSLEYISLPETLESIGEGAFSSCGFENIDIPDRVSEIGTAAFDGCENLKTIEIPALVEQIGGFTFAECSALENVKFLGNVKYIRGHQTFYKCTSLKSIELPEGLESIDALIFYNCENLESITIPRSVKEIDRTAFAGCEALENIYYKGSEQEWNNIKVQGSHNGVLEKASIHFQEIKVFVNGKEVQFDVLPQIINGRTMIPVRAVAEALGAEVRWLPVPVGIEGGYVVIEQAVDASQKIQIGFVVDGNDEDDDGLASWKITDEYHTIMQEDFAFDVKPVIRDGRTLVPIRHIAEKFGYSVNWDENARAVYIG